MKFKVLSIIFLALALVFAQGSSAQAPRHIYFPKHGHHCKRGYRRAKRHHKIACIRKAKAKTPATLSRRIPHSHLDPIYERDPLNPFKLTYFYSASATEEVEQARGQFASVPAPLPEGVLSFYTDGSLECAINVGPEVESGHCPVTLQALGQHRVTTLYTSGNLSSTATEVDNIEPLPTSTDFTAQFEQWPEAKPVSGKGEQVGVLNLHMAVSPSSAWNPKNPSLFPECEHSEEPACLPLPYMPFGIPTQLFHEGSAAVPVYMSGPNEVMIDAMPAGSSSAEVHWWPTQDIETGAHYLRFKPSMNSGFSASEGKATLEFSPEILH
jgi:hypothetical protein